MVHCIFCRQSTVETVMLQLDGICWGCHSWGRCRSQFYWAQREVHHSKTATWYRWSMLIVIKSKRLWWWYQMFVFLSESWSLAALQSVTFLTAPSVLSMEITACRILKLRTLNLSSALWTIRLCRLLSLPPQSLPLLLPLLLPFLLILQLLKLLKKHLQVNLYHTTAYITDLHNGFGLAQKSCLAM